MAEMRKTGRVLGLRDQTRELSMNKTRRGIGLVLALAGLFIFVLGAAPPASASTSLGPTQTLVGYPFYGQHGTFFLFRCFHTHNSCDGSQVMAVNNDGIWKPGNGRYGIRLSGPYYGRLGTYTGQFGYDDHIYAVNRDAIYSKLWMGGASTTDEGFAATVRATSGPYYGNVKTAFADVTGDGLTDAIAVNSYGVFVKPGRSDGTFGATQRWTATAFYGSRGTYLADVNGDRRADLIAVNATGTTVRLSTGNSFGPAGNTDRALTAPSRLAFADLSGDGKEDAVWFSNSGVMVYASTGTGFSAAPQRFTTNPYYGQRDSLVVAQGGGMTAPLVYAAVVVNNYGIFERWAL
jgi:FG-GAP-like repeat